MKSRKLITTKIYARTWRKFLASSKFDIEEARGNLTVCGEFNFACDPEAAYIVLNSYDCPTHIATWEFTYKNNLSWEFYHDWISQKSEKAEFMRKIMAHSENCTKSSAKEEDWSKGFLTCDSYAMAAAVDDTFVTDAINCVVGVELNGTLTRGMMVLDTLGKLQRKHKVCVMTKCDRDKLKFLLMEALR
ncbi:unnamed protein product [Ranitomeya imitator]|uniref:Inosine/uridine-preferring nucleoside hydrolase domain-containing protein n=1 Tax=Ranitomeya imitator TaxID=111125 RepID=A0ABN9LZX6_9NEOB|nr:unnamed protein product [Ranitomeya imitator]